MDTPEASPMTPLRFNLDERLLIKSAWLNASRYNMRFASFVVIVALLTSAYFLIDGGHRSPQRIALQVALTVAGACVLGFLVVVLLRAIFLPMQVRKNLRQQKALAEEMRLSWTDDEFCYATGKSQTVMPFKELHGFRASDDVILLYRTDLMYHLVPVAALDRSALHDAFIRRLDIAGVRRL